MKVLFATDGFPAAIAAERSITSMLRRDVAEITVVSVTHAWSLDPGHVMLELDPIDERRDDSVELAQGAAKRLQAEGFDAEARVLEGHPGHELLRETKQGGYDLVILGSGSHSWIGNHLLGSVSTLLLHEAPCSVLITHEPPADRDRARVLVGADGSANATETLAMLTEILDPARAEVKVISVMGVHLPTAVPVLTGAPYPSGETLARMDAESKRSAEIYVEGAKRAMKEAGFDVVTRVEQGGATTVILEEARQWNADLIAVGSRGLGPIRRVLLGSVSDQIARHARAAFIGRGGKEMR